MRDSTSNPQPSAALFADLPVTIGQVALFRESEADEPFLRQLYRSTREEELAATAWPETIKQSFCDSQFDLQYAHYIRQHPSGEFLVLHAGKELVGRLYLDTIGESVHVIDIAMLPAWRSRGVGSALLKAVQQRAAAAGKSLSLQVVSWNYRAIALYCRLGFTSGNIAGTHLAMHWHSAASPEAPKIS